MEKKGVCVSFFMQSNFWFLFPKDFFNIYQAFSQLNLSILIFQNQIFKESNILNEMLDLIHIICTIIDIFLHITKNFPISNFEFSF